MMGLATIKAMNEERAEQAREYGITVHTYDSPDEVGTPFPFEHIGDHRPEGWELTERHFVDSSGLGASNEPALTYHQFLDVLRDRVARHGNDVGFAIVENGQFQLYVGEFHRSA